MCVIVENSTQKSQAIVCSAPMVSIGMARCVFASRIRNGTEQNAWTSAQTLKFSTWTPASIAWAISTLTSTQIFVKINAPATSYILTIGDVTHSALSINIMTVHLVFAHSTKDGTDLIVRISALLINTYQDQTHVLAVRIINCGMHLHCRAAMYVLSGKSTKLTMGVYTADTRESEISTTAFVREIKACTNLLDALMNALMGNTSMDWLACSASRTKDGIMWTRGA